MLGNTIDSQMFLWHRLNLSNCNDQLTGTSTKSHLMTVIVTFSLLVFSIEPYRLRIQEPFDKLIWYDFWIDRYMSASCRPIWPRTVWIRRQFYLFNPCAYESWRNIHKSWSRFRNQLTNSHLSSSSPLLNFSCSWYI